MATGYSAVDVMHRFFFIVKFRQQTPFTVTLSVIKDSEFRFLSYITLTEKVLFQSLLT